MAILHALVEVVVGFVALALLVSAVMLVVYLIGEACLALGGIGMPEKDDSNEDRRRGIGLGILLLALASFFVGRGIMDMWIW